jgi:hypothetical protein
MTGSKGAMRELHQDELDAVSGAGAIVQMMEYARAVGHIVAEERDYAECRASGGCVSP